MVAPGVVGFADRHGVVGEVDIAVVAEEARQLGSCACEQVLGLISGVVLGADGEDKVEVKC
jgi:hypothetical protein